jgi:beta-xylosidase
VLEQGTTKITGPHQGGWVDTKTGEDWFVHFQDRYAYGRIVHLQPMRWENDWPVMGIDVDNNGVGEPVLTHRKPDVGRTYPITVPQTTDEFDAGPLGLQWQWQANFKTDWVSLDARPGWLRLYAQRALPSLKNLWSVPSLLLQKFPAPVFSATARFEYSSLAPGDKTGLVVFGLDYSYLGIRRTDNGFTMGQFVCARADKGSAEETVAEIAVKGAEVYFKVEVRPENPSEIIPKVLCWFSYSEDGRIFKPIGRQFIAREGIWVGAKVGVFALSAGDKPGYADVNWFRVEKLK